MKDAIEASRFAFESSIYYTERKKKPDTQGRKESVMKKTKLLSKVFKKLEWKAGRNRSRFGDNNI
jgi:hypothetical protein